MERPHILLSAVAVALLAAAVDAFYVAILISEGEGDLREPVVLVVAGLLGLTAVAVAVVARPVRFRAPVLVAAAATLAVLTVLGAASIGFLLLPAAILAGIAAARVARAR